MTTYIYALGFFDGVHLGHQALLNAVKTLAPRGQRGVVTFSGHPDTLVLGTTPELINTSEDRERLLRHFGMDRVVTLPFDKKMQSTPWRLRRGLPFRRFRRRVCFSAPGLLRKGRAALCRGTGTGGGRYSGVLYLYPPAAP